MLVLDQGALPIMMGTKARLFEPLEQVCLEDLVPKDNFYRQADGMLDLSFVRDLVQSCFAAGGRPSVDPICPGLGTRASRDAGSRHNGVLGTLHRLVRWEMNL